MTHKCSFLLACGVSQPLPFVSYNADEDAENVRGLLTTCSCQHIVLYISRHDRIYGYLFMYNLLRRKCSLLDIDSNKEKYTDSM